MQHTGNILRTVMNATLIILYIIMAAEILFLSFYFTVAVQEGL